MNTCIYVCVSYELVQHTHTSIDVMRPFFADRQKILFIPRCVQGAIICFVYLSVCVSVTFVFFTDCESCARPIFTNLGSMEAGEYGLTRRTCFVARRLEVVPVAGLL